MDFYPKSARVKDVDLRQVPDGDSYEFIVWGVFFGGFFSFLFKSRHSQACGFDIVFISR